jgi:hypothetical protein
VFNRSAFLQNKKLPLAFTAVAKAVAMFSKISKKVKSAAVVCYINDFPSHDLPFYH